MIADPFDLSLADLRERRSVRWRAHPADVLPSFVAEMDVMLADPVREALARAVAIGDTGYAYPVDVAAALSRFTARRFGWAPDPQHAMVLPDVMVAVTEVLRLVTEPGDAVVVTPPVYPPFLFVPPSMGRRLVHVPMLRGRDGTSRLDLDGLSAAFAAGAKAFLLCSPHNPTGTVPTRAELVAIATAAREHGVTVIADEIHAPLTLAGAEHVPYLSLGEELTGDDVALWSASKAWNLAGLKCAVAIAGSERAYREVLRRVPLVTQHAVGHLGAIAAVAAFDAGEPWLDAVLAALDDRRHRLASLLAERLPSVGYVPPHAGYLAWLDMRALDLGDHPARLLLRHGRIAATDGPDFGPGGEGHVRLTIATPDALLTDAVDRIAAGARAAVGQ